MHGFTTDAKSTEYIKSVFLLYDRGSFLLMIINVFMGCTTVVNDCRSLNAELICTLERGWLRTAWSVPLHVIVILFEHLVFEVSILELDVLSLINAVAGREAIEIVCIFLILIVVIVVILATAISQPHLLQVHHVLDLLGSRLMMHFTVGLQVLARTLELGVLSRVVAGQVAVLIVAEYLHLPGFGSHTAVSGVLWISLHNVLDGLILLQNWLLDLVCVWECIPTVNFAVDRWIVTFQVFTGAVLRVVIRGTCSESRVTSSVWRWDFVIVSLNGRYRCVRIGNLWWWRWLRGTTLQILSIQ